MSMTMDDPIKRWTAKRKTALVVEIIQGKTTVMLLRRRSAFASAGVSPRRVLLISTWVCSTPWPLSHRHSAIRFVTPDQRHRGEDRALLAERDRVYQLACAAHPEYWSGKTRNWQPIGSVWLNPQRPDAGPGRPKRQPENERPGQLS